MQFFDANKEFVFKLNARLVTQTRAWNEPVHVSRNVCEYDELTIDVGLEIPTTVTASINAFVFHGCPADVRGTKFDSLSGRYISLVCVGGRRMTTCLTYYTVRAIERMREKERWSEYVQIQFQFINIWTLEWAMGIDDAMCILSSNAREAVSRSIEHRRSRKLTDFILNMFVNRIIASCERSRSNDIR